MSEVTPIRECHDFRNILKWAKEVGMVSGVVAGYDADGVLMSWAGGMEGNRGFLRKDTLWLLEQVKHDIMFGE